uniref:Uncharacterized protein n=1 Tax=Cannabis sativa TaxID=3483 RepID=A0A803PSW0_CANSA
MLQGAGLIAWESVCQSKANGGVGFKKIAEWNVAALFNYVWAIANKEDNLWVRWVHSVYLKDEEWWSYEPPLNASWYWRRLVVVKDQFKQVDLQQISGVKYHISHGYKLLCPSQNKVRWSNEVKTWLSWRAKSNQLSNLIRWIGKGKCTKFCKQVYLAAMAALVYQIWRARNDIVWNSKG